MTRVDDTERDMQLTTLRALHDFRDFPPVGEEEEQYFRFLMWMAETLGLKSCSAYYSNVYRLRRPMPQRR